MSLSGKLEGEVEVNCSADEVFHMFLGKQHHIPTACGDHITNIEAHQSDWVGVGSTRQWDCVIDGKNETLIDRIDEVDEENKITRRTVLGGEMITENYTDFVTTMEFIPTGDGCCIVKITFEYEKLNENCDEPQKLLDFSLGVAKGLEPHILANA